MSHDPNQPPPSQHPGYYPPGYPPPYGYPPAPPYGYPPGPPANPLEFGGREEEPTRPRRKAGTRTPAWAWLVGLCAILLVCAASYFVWDNIRFKRDGARLVEIRKEKAALEKVFEPLPAHNALEREIADNAQRKWMAENSDKVSEIQRRIFQLEAEENAIVARHPQLAR